MARKFPLIPAKSHINAIERRYGRAEREIRKALMRIDISSFSEMTAISAQNKVTSLVKRLNRDASRWAISAVKDAYVGSKKKTEVMLEVLGAEKDPMFDNKEHYRTMNTLMDTISEDFFKANMGIKQTVDTFVYLARAASRGLKQIQAFSPEDEGIIGDIITDTIAKEESRQYAYNRIYEHFRLKLLDGNFIDRRGRHYNLRSYSQMVARTRLRGAETEATKNMCKEFNNDLVRVSKHHAPCEKCVPYEDKVYSLSGTHPTYPLLPISMPIHPRCKHSISPTSEEAIKFREKYAEIEAEKYRLEQPKHLREAKNNILNNYRTDGNEHAMAFDKNGNLLIKKSGSPDGIHYSSQELYRNWEAHIHIHNHPNNTAFSTADLEFYSAMQIKKGIVVSDRFTYELSPIGKKWPSERAMTSYWNSQMNNSVLKKKYGNFDPGLWPNHVHEIMQKLSSKFNLNYKRTITTGG